MIASGCARTEIASVNGRPQEGAAGGGRRDGRGARSVTNLTVFGHLSGCWLLAGLSILDSRLHADWLAEGTRSS
jgi:hypothetical protein